MKKIKSGAGTNPGGRKTKTVVQSHIVKALDGDWNALKQRKVNPSTESTDGVQRHGTLNQRQTLAKITRKRRNNTSLNRVTHIGRGHSRHYYYYYYTTTSYSVLIVLRKETAFPRCRAMDRCWNRKTVSLVSWVMTVVRLPISCYY